MTKTCRCGQSYDAGEGLLYLPVCPACAPLWDAEIESRIPKETIDVDEEAGLEALGIRPRHYKCTFDNFEIDSEKGRAAFEACKRMAETRDGFIIMVGNNGTGKTHLDCATVRAIGAGRIYKMVEIGMFIRKYIGSQTIDEQGQLDYLVRLPFLAIDEFDKCKRSESELIWLSYILDERIERHKATIFSGNCHPQKIHSDGKPCEKCFETIVTPDILDRTTQFGTFHYFDGESHRRELRGKE